MIRLPPRSTRTDTLFPYTTLFRSTGDFEQGAVDGQGKLVRPQQGKFSFQRPGKFRWEVQKPYAQLIVSDGRYAYKYDPDLAQVTRRRARDSIGASPAALLFRSEERRGGNEGVSACRSRWSPYH